MVATDWKQSLIDPSSIKDAVISSPAVRRIGLFRGSRPTICVRYDAKDAKGVYTGASSTIYWFRGGQVAGSRRRQSFCSSATYAAFPEAGPPVARPAARIEHGPLPGKKSAKSVAPVKPAPAKGEASKPQKSSDAGGDPHVYYDERHAETWFRQQL